MRFRIVGGEQVPLTKEQNEERDREEAAFAERLAAAQDKMATRDLSPSEFRGLLAAEETLGEIYDGMRVALKGAPGSTAKKQRFMLDANRSKKSYSLAATLLMVASFRTFAYSLYPPEDLARITLALSDDVVTAAWMEAVQMGDEMRAPV